MKKYESVFFIPWPVVNFHRNRGDFLLKIRGGPWTRSMGWSMDRVHGVVHGPRSMFCIRPAEEANFKANFSFFTSLLTTEACVFEVTFIGLYGKKCWFYCDSGLFLLRRKRFVEWRLASDGWSRRSAILNIVEEKALGTKLQNKDTTYFNRKAEN